MVIFNMEAGAATSKELTTFDAGVRLYCAVAKIQSAPSSQSECRFSLAVVVKFISLCQILQFSPGFELSTHGQS